MSRTTSSKARSFSRLIAATIFLLAGCAQIGPGSSTRPGEPPAVSNAPRYDAVAGQDPATIAALRAAPAPKEPQIADGTALSGDEQSLNARSFARIGDAYVPAATGNTRAWIVEQGRRVGADKILVYAPGSDGVTHASYYVRYRLPFGATFRTVSAEEREMLGSGGVQIGDVVAGTPASEANLLKGDFIVKFDGRAFADRAAFEKLLREHLGARVTLTVSRNGAEFPRLVRLGSIARPADDGKH